MLLPTTLVDWLELPGSVPGLCFLSFIKDKLASNLSIHSGSRSDSGLLDLLDRLERLLSTDLSLFLPRPAVVAAKEALDTSSWASVHDRGVARDVVSAQG